MEFVIYFSKLERCEVIIKARPTRVIRYLAIVALCLLLGFMLGRKSKYEKRDYLKQFKIGKATYSESLIYEAYGGLQNDGIMLAVYYDVDAAKIIHQLDSWEKINDSPTISSILKNATWLSSTNSRKSSGKKSSRVMGAEPAGRSEMMRE